MPRTPDEMVEAAVASVLQSSHRVETLERLHELVREALRAMDGGYTVSRERLRRLILTRKLAKVEIQARDDASEDFPGNCPLCRSPMKNVKNETLYGWAVTLQRRCTVCPYWSGKNRRVPTLYIFHSL